LLKTCYDMHLSSSFRGRCLSLVLIMAAPVFSFAQSPFSAGAESSLVGALPGDQVHPHLSINASGGFAVWEDNHADPYGMGLKAVALDANLLHRGAPFRVNKNGAGDQEHPRVALLNGGGAVFIWQGGRPGFQHIFARFLSASNTWLSDDIQVNTFAKNAQVHPDVTVLTNGNVVVVWSSFNQASSTSMQDIYAQMFTPAGAKVGNEIPVNQATLYNQRTPSIAALADGGFVITWVSEMQRVIPVVDANGIEITNTTSVLTRPSVDLYTRTYDGTGSPTRGEVLVNTGNEPCTSPSVAGASDGGFMVAWAQHDMLNRSNSWDIYVRSFSQSGLAGTARPVNTQLYGDQYMPSLVAAGSDYLAVWTSMGQDGSREGVYGQFLQPDGSPTGSEFRVNDTVVSSQMHPACAADGQGRFLAVWTSFVGVNTSFDLYTKQFTSTNFVPSDASIVYAAPPLEAFNDTPVIVGGDSGPPKIDPPPPPPSVGVSNHIGFLKATYCGLFYDETNGVSSSSAGSFTLTATAQGTFSAKIGLAGRNYSASGRFDGFGSANVKISRGALRALNLQLSLDVSQNQVTGTLSDGNWIAGLAANRSMATSTANGTKSAPGFAGTYTLDIPGAGMTTLSPVGDGFGTIKVDNSGNVSWAVSLADGTKVTQKSALTQNGVCPLYLPLYSGGGSVLGWMQFGTNGFDGMAVWIKQAGGSAKYYYPGGFTNQMDISGAVYQKPLAGHRALDWANGQGMALLNGGSLSTATATPITIDSNNRLTSSSDPSLKLSVSSSSGLVTGSFLSPTTGKKVSFQGAVFQNRKLARGYFLDSSQSGQVSLEAAP
jgi:hypothetical protein